MVNLQIMIPINKNKTRIITHGASEASGVRNFWYLSAKILYTVEPKTATPPCVHFEVAASPTEKKHHFSMYPFLVTFRLWR